MGEREIEEREAEVGSSVGEAQSSKYPANKRGVRALIGLNETGATSPLFQVTKLFEVTTGAILCAIVYRHTQLRLDISCYMSSIAANVISPQGAVSRFVILVVLPRYR